MGRRMTISILNIIEDCNKGLRLLVDKKQKNQSKQIIGAYFPVKTDPYDILPLMTLQ